MGMTFQPTKLSPSVDEAQRLAAEYCLVQLGYPGLADCKSLLIPAKRGRSFMV